MANKYLDLIGLATYHKGLLNTFSNATYDSTNGFVFNTYPNATVNSTTGAVSKGTATNSGVSISTLKTDLGITNVINDIAEGTTDGTISVTKNNGTATDVAVHGLGSAAYTASGDYATAAQGAKADTAVQSFTGITASVTNGVADVTAVPADIIGTTDHMTLSTGVQAVAPTNDGDVANKKYVDDAITGVSGGMVFKGTLGAQADNPTITELPTASASNVGFVYKVITAGTYNSQVCKVGDMWICANTGNSTYAWTYVPSGDDVDVTSVGVSGDGLQTVIGGTAGTTAITDAGSIKLVPATLTENGGVYTSTLGGVTVNENSNITLNNSTGVISVATANGTNLGLAKQGTNVAVDSNGAINVATASAGSVGVATVAANADGGLNINDGVISVNTISYSTAGGATDEIAALFN